MSIVFRLVISPNVISSNVVLPVWNSSRGACLFTLAWLLWLLQQVHFICFRGPVICHRTLWHPWKGWTMRFIVIHPASAGKGRARRLLGRGSQRLTLRGDPSGRSVREMVTTLWFVSNVQCTSRKVDLKRWHCCTYKVVIFYCIFGIRRL